MPGDQEPKFCVGVVLVENGQSQQEYRLCINLVLPNSRLILVAAPLVDIPSALHELQGSSIFTAIDVKAGFFNIPLHSSVITYMGIVT